MSKLIKGEDVALYLGDKQAFHATSHTLSVSLELSDFRTKDTDGDEKSPGDASFTAQLEGLVVLDDNMPNTSMSSEDILDSLLNKTKLVAVFKSRTTAGGLTKAYTGNGYITQFDYATPVGDKMTYSATFTGTGKLTPVTASEQSGSSQTEATNEQSN